jgi:hypothetical protein
MKCYLNSWVAMFCLVISSGLCQADESRRAIDQLADFLKQNAIGKTLEWKFEGPIADGKFETEFQRHTTFSNFTEYRNGLAFDEIAVIQQVNYDLDEAGNRVGEGIEKNRVLTVRWELGHRASSGGVTGFRRIVSNSMDTEVGWCQATRIVQENGRWVAYSEDPIYSDHFSSGDTVVPGMEKVREEIWFEDQRLYRQTTRQAFYVDPDTWKKTHRGEEMIVNESTK